MGTFLRATLVVGLLLVLAGTAQAVSLDLTTSPSIDLGNPPTDPAIAGSTSVFPFTTISGGGSGIGGTGDHGFFLYEEVVGDGSVSVRIQSFLGGTNDDRVAGVMVRDSLAADSANVANFILPTNLGVFPADKKAQGQVRTSAGGGTSIIGAPDPAPPEGADTPGVGDFIRVTRSGNQFTFSWSPGSDGVTWTDYGSIATVDMVGTVYIGLAVSSNDNAEAATARIRDWATPGWGTRSTLTWDGAGDGNWADPSRWVPGPATPDVTTDVVIASAGQTVTAGAGGSALSLDVAGSDLVVAANQVLSVEMDLNIGAGGFLDLRQGSSLVAKSGGSIENLQALKSGVAIDTWKDVSVENFLGIHFPDVAGSLYKQGGATLQLDNSAGIVSAPATTFDVEAGTLASKGLNPLGGAMGVILRGSSLKLENPGGAISVAGTVQVTGDSTVETDSDGASLGALTLDAVTLTTTGSGPLGFASTNLSPGVAGVTLNTGIDTSSGPINVDAADSPTITKTGGAKLIVAQAGANIGNATFDVKSGALVGVAASNPFGDAELVLSGGELILANDGADDPAVFDNALRLTANSDLTGGTGGLSVGGAPNVQLGGVNGVDMNGKQLRVGTTDGYTLNIAGAFPDSGEVRMKDGNVTLSGGGGGTSMDARTIGNGTLTISTNLMSFDDLRTRSAGTINIVGEVVVTDDLSIRNGGTVQTSAPLTAADVEVTDGALNTSALLTVTDWMDVSGGSVNLAAKATAPDVTLSGSAAVSATELVISNSLKQGPNTYLVDSGTMTASGSDMLNGVNLAFGGNTLTVHKSLAGVWTFDDDTANDSSGNGYDGVLTNGAYSGDVPGVLGGRSLDLTSGDSYVVVDTGGSQDVFDGNANMTVSAWMKGWPDGNWEPFISKGGESGQGWQVRRRGGSSNDLTFTLRGVGNDDPYMGDSPVGNRRDEWHHVVVTFDGSTRKLYINNGELTEDGKPYWDEGGAGTINGTISRLVFGARDKDGWNGGGGLEIESISHVRLDDIYFWNRAISDAEVAALFNNDSSVIGLDVSTTNLMVTDDATLLAETTVGAATFGNLALDGGATLTLSSNAPDGFSFGTVSGDGTILGSLTARDGASPGSSAGTLNVTGDLAFGSGATYEWDLGAGGSDLINVSGDLDVAAGWTLKIVSSESFFAPGRHTLMTYGGDLFFDAPTIDLSMADGWRNSGLLRVLADRSGNVILKVVPEPSTWILLLTAGMAGLLAYARRRRQAA